MSLLITIGPEYSGSMFLYHNAEKSADLFEKCFVDKFGISTVKIRGKSANAQNIINTINEHIYREDLQLLYIYYCGHGNHINKKEFWDTASGHVDQQTIAKIVNKSNPLVVVISDSCSSEHMINLKLINHRYISIGATLDHQDAIMTGDGGLFTNIFIERISDFSSETTFAELHLAMKDSPEIETFSFLYSSQEVLDHKLFV